MVENPYPIGPAMVTEEQYQCLKAAVAYDEKELAKLTQEMYDWLENVVGIKYNSNSGPVGGRAWLYIPLFEATGEIRDPSLISFLVEQFDVENNERYLKENGDTFCNIFAWDVTKALGSLIPHWIYETEEDFYEFEWSSTKPTRQGYIYPEESADSPVREASANHLYEMLSEHGDKIGYTEVSKEEAQIAANQGKIAVIVSHSGTENESGHIAIVLPNDKEDGIYIAQAGNENSSYRPAFENGEFKYIPFNEDKIVTHEITHEELPIKYFVHD